MKRWLITSLVINVVLIALLLFTTRPVETEVVPAPQIAEAAAGSNVPTANVPPPKTVSVFRAAAGGWHSWLDELRAAGVPNRILARLVSADFENRWEERQRAMQHQ